MNPSESDVTGWCVQQLAAMLERPAETIDPNVKFARLGMDSIHMSELIVALENWLKTELDPEVAFNHPTIAGLAKHLAAASSKEAAE